MTEKVVELGRDRIKIAKGSEKPVEFYTEETVESLMFHLEKSKIIRGKVVVQLLLFTGVRVSELYGIRIRDIEVLKRLMTIIKTIS